MKVGVIYCGYNTEDYLKKSISPWIEARIKQLDGHFFSISAVSQPFKNFPGQGQDSTTKQLQILADSGAIKEVFSGTEPIDEAAARNLCLNSLLKEGCDIIWQVDSDEFFSLENISSILKYIEKDKLVAWYRISYKNYVFDTNTYLEEPFTPPRIHKVNIGKYTLHEFTYDNDISYKNDIVIVGQHQLASKVIPAKIAFIPHFTWLNNQKSKDKIQYHTSRGWICSYQWDEQKGLQFCPEYYTKNGKVLPKVLKDY